MIAEPWCASARVQRNGWTVVDAGRLAAARARLDAIAYGIGGGVDLAQAALAGLATAFGLPPLIYRGFGGSAGG